MYPNATVSSLISFLKLTLRKVELPILKHKHHPKIQCFFFFLETTRETSYFFQKMMLGILNLKEYYDLPSKFIAYF